jgi:hypothetical protein
MSHALQQGFNAIENVQGPLAEAFCMSLDVLQKNLDSILRNSDCLMRQCPYEYSRVLKYIRNAADLELNFIENHKRMEN